MTARMMTHAIAIAFILAVIASLQEYEPKLKGISEEKLVSLVRKVRFTQAGFVPDTETEITANSIITTVIPANRYLLFNHFF